MSAHLTLASLSKRYGSTVAVADVSLEVAQGESVALLGPSGCGKTTTLRMIAGLITPDSGVITVRGRDLTRLPAFQRNMGYVFQSYALFPHLTVAANVGFGLDERGVGRAERDEKVRAALGMVRLSGLEARKPRELSGGQQQRVALARALVIQPDVLLLDESLSNLDAKLRDAMRIEIRELQRKLAITTLFVTHDQTEALTLCDRVAVMNGGRIEQVADPRAIYDRPATRFVADFVGRSNVLSGTRTAQNVLDVAGARILAPFLPGDGHRFDLYLRPQRLRLVQPDEALGAQNHLIGQVAAEVFVGDRIEVLVETAAGRLTVEIASGSPAPRPGEAVCVVWAVEDTLAFPEHGA
ncbi:PotA ABC-type spermidine/putrescine transport systems, ATPase components [Rhabdaerophilaceae bacterium]